jgi:hypothetical protein
MVGGQAGFESVALRLMTTAKGGAGLGTYLPSIAVVALGEPGTPAVCWALAVKAVSRKTVRSMIS